MRQCSTLGSAFSNSPVVALPLGDQCQRVLAYAGEEAEKLSHRFIGTKHLLLGLLREEKCLGAHLLKQRGISLETVRASLQK